MASRFLFLSVPNSKNRGKTNLHIRGFFLPWHLAFLSCLLVASSSSSSSFPLSLCVCVCVCVCLCVCFSPLGFAVQPLKHSPSPLFLLWCCCQREFFFFVSFFLGGKPYNTNTPLTRSKQPSKQAGTRLHPPPTTPHLW